MEVFWVESPLRVAIATRPRGGDWLRDDLDRARLAGLDVLVSLLEEHEEVALDLTDEARLAELAGLEFVRIPVSDLGTPLPSAVPVLQSLLDLARSGRSIAAHCRMGIGRSPLAIGSLLVLDGVDPETAWTRLRTARGLPVPDTDAQRRWLFDLVPGGNGR